MSLRVTDAERIEKALDALTWHAADGREECRALLEQLVAGSRAEDEVAAGRLRVAFNAERAEIERMRAEIMRIGVERLKESLDARTERDTAQQRAEGLEGALRQLAEDWGNEAGRRRILALLAAKEKL